MCLRTSITIAAGVVLLLCLLVTTTSLQRGRRLQTTGLREGRRVNGVQPDVQYTTGNSPAAASLLVLLIVREVQSAAAGAPGLSQQRQRCTECFQTNTRWRRKSPDTASAPTSLTTATVPPPPPALTAELLIS